MKLFPCLVLKNGAKVSIQASRFHYSIPRDDTDSYTMVEVFITNDSDIPTYLQDRWDGFVYSYVPVEEIEKYISDIGIDIGKTLGRFRIFHVPGDF